MTRTPFAFAIWGIGWAGAAIVGTITVIHVLINDVPNVMALTEWWVTLFFLILTCIGGILQ